MGADVAFILTPPNVKPIAIAHEAATFAREVGVRELALYHGTDVAVAGSGDARVCYSELWAPEPVRHRFGIDAIASRISIRFGARVLSADYFDHASTAGYTLFERGEIVEARVHPPEGDWFGQLVADAIAGYLGNPVVTDPNIGFNHTMFPSGFDDIATWRVLEQGAWTWRNVEEHPMELDLSACCWRERISDSLVARVRSER